MVPDLKEYAVQLCDVRQVINLSELYFSSSSEEWESYNLLCRVTGFSLLKRGELQHGEAQPCCTEDKNDNR